MAKKWICTVCGYVHEGDEAPEKCPKCKAPAAKFKELEQPAPSAAGKKGGINIKFVTEHHVGEAKGVSEEMRKDLETHFNGECAEVGMYLAMARQADREGYPEIAEAFKRYAFEEADHAARIAEMLGEVLTDSTKKNVEMRAAAEFGACDGKKKIATLAKELGYDAVHDSIHEMAKDEARHGKGFDGLLKRYFK